MTHVPGTRRAALLALLLCSCGAEAVTVDCRMVDSACPTDEAIGSALTLFAEHYPFDPSATLRIEWHAPLTCVLEDLDGSCTTVGLTTGGEDIKVTGYGVLFHELVHVSLFRRGIDPDGDHEQGSGPWTDRDNCMIEAMQLEYLTLDKSGYYACQHSSR